MSWEAWGTPEDPEPNLCEMCDNELGSSTDCKLCATEARAQKVESELRELRITVAHRVRILNSRSVYEGGKKENGVSVELLKAMSLLSGIPGVLREDEIDARLVAEAEKALLTLENGRYVFAPRREARVEPIAGPSSEALSMSMFASREDFDAARREASAGSAGSNKKAPESSSAAPVEAVEVLRTLTFDAFRRANVARCVKWHPEGIASWSPSDWLVAVTGELGELASLLKMRNRERDGLPGNKFSPTDKMVADELADVLTYLDLLAEILGVDLGAAAVAKFNEVSERVGFSDRIVLRSPPAELVAQPTQAVQEDERDAKRLDWLNSQGIAYGFEDIHEGNRWTVDGPFSTVRDAIDAAISATTKEQN